MWGFPANGELTIKEGEYSNTKHDNVTQAVYDHIAREEWGTVLNELAERVPASRLTLLWDIVMETDLSDLEQLEEKIYSYGRSLGSKDHFGRIVFTRMAQALRSAQNATA